MPDARPSDPYENYVAWKDWRELFVCSPDAADYYSGETRDLRIADADVLEIGFGSGTFLAFARARGARAVGAEIIADLIEAARAQGFALLDGTLEAAARTTPARFDTIVAFDVFEHFEEADLLRNLDAAAGLLKPGGRLLLRFPNGQSPFGLAPQNGDPTHRAALSGEKFAYFLRGRPFEILRYGDAFAAPGRNWKQWLGRAARAALRGGIARALNAIYGMTIPWGPVVTLVLTRKA